jgi:hypothetical protein
MNAAGTKGYCRTERRRWPLPEGRLSYIGGAPPRQQGDDKVRVYDRETRTSFRMPACELTPDMVRIGGAAGADIWMDRDLADFKSSENLHPEFPDGFRGLIGEVGDAFADVWPHTDQEWTSYFRSVQCCDSELAAFHAVAVFYRYCTAGASPSRRGREDILRLVWGPLTGSDERALTTQTSVLTPAEAQKIIKTLRAKWLAPFGDALRRVGGYRFDQAGGPLQVSVADLVDSRGTKFDRLLYAADAVWAVAAGSGEEKMLFVREPLGGGTGAGNARPLRVLRVEVNPEGTDDNALLGEVARIALEEDHVAFDVGREVDPSEGVFDDAPPHQGSGRALLVDRLLRANGPDLPVLERGGDGRWEVLHGRDRLEAARSAGRKTCSVYALLGRCRDLWGQVSRPAGEADSSNP